MMRIAVILMDLPPGTGLSLVVHNLLKGLEQHTVRFFILRRGYYSQYASDPKDFPYPCEEYAPTGFGTPVRKLSRASRYYGVDLARLTWLEGRLLSYGADRVVGFDYNLAPYIGSLSSNVPKILNVVDSEVFYWANQIISSKPSVSTLKHLIAAVLTGRENFPKCSAIVTVSKSDSRNLRRYAAAQNVYTVPNGVDHNWFCPNPAVKKHPNRIVFCGSLSFLPNIQAIDWFLKHCWQDILAQQPKANLIVIGKNPPPDLRPRLEAYPGVCVVGPVDDIRSHILSSAVSIAPMVSGSGIKNKILEAWALATPVVATRRAVTGLVCEHGRQILVADRPSAFARNVISLLTDPAKRDQIGSAGRDHVVHTYSWELSRNMFRSIVESPGHAHLHDL